MPINASRDLVKKLLQLFPVKFLKDHFDQSGNRDDIIEEISSKPDAQILAFIRIYHDVTRQNIYLFKLSRNFDPRLDMVNFPLEISDLSTNNSEHTFICFTRAIYSVYLSEPIQKVDLEFLQPIVIEFFNDNLVLKFTKLEKNIKNYFNDDRGPKLAGESNNEEYAFKIILEHFRNQIGVSSNDFNAGIKRLWEIDELDCHKIRYRDAHSTNLITMDNTLTFKQQYPEKYREMVHAPIGPSVWKFLNVSADFIDTFTCDPSEGIIGVNKFTDNTNQVSNVITRILNEN